MKAEENFVKDMDVLRKALNEPDTSISMPKRNTLSDPVYRSICKRAMRGLDNIELMRKEIVDPKAYEQAVQPSIEDLELLFMEWRTFYGLSRYDLANEFFSILEKAIPSRCPEIGVGFKAYKALTVDFETPSAWSPNICCPAIATIWIPENAKRSSAFGNKCRADEIQVTDIVIERNGEERHFDCGRSPIRSMKADGILYCVGRTYISKFNPNRWEECADGIHFFMTEKEAVKFSNTIPWIPPMNVMTAKAKGEEDYA